MEQKARYIKGFGVFGGVGDSKEEGEGSRGREVAGRAAVGGLGLGWRVLKGAGEAVGVDGGRIITLGTMYSCVVYVGV